MSKKTKNNRYQAKLILEELEARQLFSDGAAALAPPPPSSDAAATVTSINVDANLNPIQENTAQANNGLITETPSPIATQAVINLTSPAPSNTQDSATVLPANNITPPQETTISKELVFVDTKVENFQALVDDITHKADNPSQFEVVLLDPNKEGISQITETLAHYKDLTAVHFITHGSDGSLDIGNSQLNFQTLSQHQDEISTWSHAFADQGDILIYGCNVAQTQFGQSFVDYLSSLTQTDIAASEDATGFSGLNADWNLEYQSGTIEAKNAISVAEQAQWTEQLAVTSNGTVTSTSNTNTTSLTWAHTVNSGVNRALFVEISIDNLGANVNSVTYGGVALTQVGRQGGNHAVEIWRLVNPTVGTGNVVVSLSGNTAVAAGASTFNGVNQSTPTGTFAGNSGTTLSILTPGSVTVASAPGDLVIDAQFWADVLANPVGAGQTSQWSSSSLLTSALGSSSTEAGAASVTMSGTSAFITNWSIGAVSVKAATQSTPPANSVPSAQTTNEDTAKVFSSANGNQIFITDADAGAGSNEITLSVTNGTLTLAGTTGLTFSSGDGTADSTMTFRGTASAINTALNGLSYTPTANYNGSDTLTLRTLDSTLVSLNIDANLQARYTFEGNANDVAAGTSQNGTLVGNATYVNDGTRGQVLTLDGSGDSVQINSTFGQPQNVTIGGWVNLSAGTGRKEFISIDDRVHIALDDVGGVKGSVQVGAGVWTDLNSNQFIAGTGWHHVMYVFNGTSDVHTLYIDGAQVASAANTNTIYYTGATTTYIGQHPSNTAWNLNGLVDDVRIYDKALSGSEVAALATDLSLIDTDTVAFTITAVNDAPVNTVPNDQYTPINSAISFSSGNGNAISIADADAGTNTIQTSLSVSHGTLTLSGTTGLTITSGSNGSASMTITGTISNINTALNGLVYTPSNGYRGIDSLQLMSNDLGNSGSGGAQSTTSSINLMVGAIAVTNTNDNLNGNTSSISALVASSGGDGISLREAITAANNTAGTDYIYFSVSGTGIHTINLTSALPTITTPMVIDGTSDDSYAANSNRPAIELNGTSAGAGVVGLNLTAGASSSTIRGLAINRFTSHGILLNDADNVTIAGNFIGTDTTGLIARANSGNGIQLNNGAQNNTIGGLTSSDRNIISGNSLAGIAIDNLTSTGNVIIGNYIGLAANGYTSLGNGNDGVHFNTAGANTVGSTNSAGRNVISGNTLNGIGVSDSSGVTIIGNYIGTDATGVNANGNGSAGIQFSSTLTVTSGTVGGTATGAGNLISYNTGDGVYIPSTTVTGISVLGNSISNNTQSGIDLGTNGVTANDAGDADTGANNLQNFPALTSISSTVSGTTFVGTLNSTANTTFRIEFFTNLPSTTDSNGEGDRYLGFVNVTTNGSGNASFNTLIANAWVNAGDKISATATVYNGGSSYGSTSEFSANVAATSTGIVVVDTTSDMADGTTTSISALAAARGVDGRISLREAITATNNTANGASADKIVFAIPQLASYYSSGTLSQAIPDFVGSTPGIATSTIAVSNSGTVTDVNVQINLTHSWDSDLQITLIAPDGTRILLASALGSSNDNYTYTLFDDEASAAIAAGTAPFTGTFKPNTSLSGLDGKSASGTWTLEVKDTANGDTGTLLGWSLALATDQTSTATINVGSLLPSITQALTLDGTSQTGYSSSPLVTLNGRNAVLDGLELYTGSSGSTVRGLVIQNFTQDGIDIASSNGNTIAGNWIGLSSLGTSAAGNANGVNIWDSSSNIIGGTTAADRNVISGNTNGIWMGGSVGVGSSNNQIIGNYIGTNALGTAGVGNTNGMDISTYAFNNIVGGTTTGSGNVIAYNSWLGVSVSGTGDVGNALLGNTYYSNGSLGIDINWDGPTPNDAGDVDTGANNFQNFPVLSSARSTGGNTIISGTLNSAASTSYRIEFYSNPAGTQDASGYGEGSVYLGYVDVTTDASGNASFSTTLTGVTVATGDRVTATATQKTGVSSFASTSEFALNVIANNLPVNTVPGAQTVNEDTALAITGVSVNDVDGNLATTQLTVSNGILTVSLAGGATISAGANSSATLTLAGTQAQINAAIATLTYQGRSNYSGSDILTILSTDTYGATDSDTVAITVSAVNDSPNDLYVIPGLQQSSLLGVYGFTSPSNLGHNDIVGNTAITLFGNPGQVTGPTGTGALDLAGGISGQYGDITGITTGGAMTFAASVRFDTTADWQRVFDFGQAFSTGIGNVYVGREFNTNNLTFTIEKNGVYVYRATAANAITNGSWLHFAATVDASGNMKLYINGNLTASTSGVALETGVRTNNFIGKSHWNDPAFDGAIDNFVVANGVMTASQVSALYLQSVGFSVPENSANGTVIGTVVALDPDPNDTFSYTLTDNAGGRFSINASTGTITVANSTLLDYETATSHSITVKVTDQGSLSYSETITVGVTNIVDSPTVTNLSAAETYTEDTALNLTDIVITTSDSSTVTATLTLSNPSAGSLSTATSGLVTSTYNAGTGVWTASGSTADVNALLAGLVFTPAANYNSSFTIATSVTNGLAAAVTGTKSISGIAVNDAPTNSVPGLQTTNEDTTKVFSSANGNAITVTDVDAGSGSNEITLSVTNGTLTLSGVTGLTFTVGNGTNNTTMTFRGTASAINTALNGLSYSPTANYNGSATLTLTTKDSVLLSLDIDTSLKGHYTFENTGALGTDTSPAGGYVGTVVNGTNVNDLTRGNVLSLAGNGYIQTTGHFGDPSNVTVAAWVKLTTADSAGSDVISLGDSVVIRLDSGGQLKGYFYYGSGHYSFLQYTTTLAGSGWHHVALSIDSTNHSQNLYLDGIQVASAANTNAISYTLGANSFIGTHGNGATTADFTGKIDDARIYNRALTADEVYTLANDLAMTATNSVAQTITPVNDAPAGTVTITGTPTQNQTLTAANSLTDVDGLGTISYQWYANGTAISGATGSTYTLTQAEVGKTITVTASYTDGQGTAEAVTSNPTTAVANVNDAPAGTVTITGTPSQNQTLTAANSLTDVDGLGTISYQWYANGTAISGATGSTYTLTQAEVGKTITVTASYTDGQGTAEAVTSNPTTAVANVNDAPAGTVTITGTPSQNQILTAANSLTDVDGLGTISYQWYANGTAISGATGSTYTLTQAEVGKTITVTASYTDGQGTAEAVTSNPTTAVANVNDAPAGTVTITGTPSQNQTLTAANSLTDVDGLGTISYQWYANGTAISGATGSTYTLTQAEVGKTITVTASYTDGQGTAEAVTSNPTTAVANVNDAPAGTVTITGTPSQNQTLTAANSLTDVDGLGTISYQWYANGTAISGATGSTYTLTQAEVGKTITVTASYTDGQGTAEAVTSNPTTAVANVNDAPAGTVTITGTPSQNQTLTAANSLTDVDGLGTISYQWYANGTAISGATGSTYTLTQAEVGKTITVTASYTDGQGTAEAVTSNPTTAVANVNDAPAGTVTITGTPSQNQTLTAANSLTDVDGLGTISYQWYANGTAISGATGSTYTLTQAEVGKTITVTASYTDGQGTAEAVTSNPTTAVANVNDAPAGTVTITGTPSQNQTLTAANSLTDVDGLGTISYQWYANGTAISGATGSTYTLTQAEVGKTITVTASYTDGQGTAEAVTSNPTTAVANVNDAPAGTVTITGTPSQNQTLTAANSLTDVDGLGTISYQWYANGTAISGATGSTYTLTQAEVGKTITVTASYTDGQGTAEAVTSNPTTAVANVNDAPAGTVTITGTPSQNQTLTAANSLTDVDGLGTISYQWYANGTAISGATGSTYTLTQAEVGKTITVTASYTDGQGTAEAVTSNPTTAVANVNDAPTGTVTITGTPSQNQTLTAANSLTDVDGLGTISYQWYANGTAISGATGSTYTLTQAEVGKTITVTASYTDGQGTAEAVTSNPTTAVANVNDAPAGTVTITGTPSQNQTLTAANSLTDVDGLGTISYQWYANGTAISGATGSTYTLTQAEVGKTITVTASYTDGQGTAEAVTSNPTTAVANVNDAPAGTVTITGTPSQNQTLTAANSLTDVDGLGTISYQWYANGTAISGATGSTYTLTQAEVGKTITVTASYTDGQGTAEAVTSNPTTAVANVNDAPAGTVTITGTPSQNQTLTAANSLTDVDGLGTISYQWYANGTAISGATGSTYTLTQAEVGKTITVTASYTDGQGTAEAVTSNPTTAVANVNDAPAGTVTITGTPSQNQTLTAANSLTDVDGLGTISYQWYANGTAISGATGSTYTLTQAEVGKTITVTASYTDGQGTAEAVTSNPTTAVANVNDAPAGTVTITGTPSQNQTLTAANSLTDVDGLGTISYQWYANGTAISGATGSTYTLTQAEVGKTITVTASYTDGQGTAEAVTSNPTTAVANVNDAPAGTVTITGTPSQNQTLTAANSLTDVDGLGTISYQWYANGTAISGATGSTYTLTQAEVGKTITVTASYTDGQGTAEAVTSNPTTAVANVNDAPAGTVTITGTPSQNQTLTAANSLTDVDGLGTISYQWYANGTAISGATGSTYTLTQAEVGKTITVTASYTDGQGTAEAVTSNPTTAVANVNDAPAGTVTITGTPSQNQTLTAANSLTDVDGLGTISYQWYANGTAISGATGSTYTLTQAEVGKTITVTASYTDGQGTAEAVTSNPTTAVANVNDAPAGTVTITGTPSQNQTLTAANSLTDVDGLGTISYQWYANGTAISGATGSTYTLTQAEVGKTITVTASYTDGQGTAEAVTSNPTTAVANVNDAPAGTVTITGTPSQNQTLTAANSLTDVDGLGTISYQWYANGTAISGATGSTYTLTQAEVGKTITVTASYTDGQGTAEAVTSNPTTAVANVNDAPAGTVTITGTPSQNQTLTAANSLTDVDGLGTISYQWYANGTAISGATGSTYTLTQAEVGKTITVTASYTDGQGTAEAVTSNPTTAVANVNDAPAGTVTITGTPSQNQTLTAANSLTDVDGLGTISYQWYANGTAISGATGSTYTLTQAEVGKTITVTASYTDGQGTAEAVTSNPTTAVANVNDAPAGTVTITGTPSQNQTLTAANSLTDVDGLGTISYQWYANGTAISGATGSTYTLTQAEVGKTITVTASYTDGQGTAEAVTSNPTTAVANVNDAPAGTVTITGTPSQNQTLTAANSLTDVDGLGTISYQWYANGTAISGATGSTYTLTQAEVGKTITVTASYTDGQGTAEAVTSNPTTAVANVNDAPAGTVTITGTPSQNQTLTAANSLTDVDGLGTISYQWYANGTAISGATGSTYTLTQAEVGKTITVTASYTDGQGTAEAVTSNPTTAVANVNDAPAGTVTITGTPSQNQTLTAANSLTDVDGLGTISYQWYANGTAISGATGSTYTLTQAEVGKTITVTASYTDGQGTAEAVTSNPTTAVANVNDAPAGTVTITGTPSQNQILTAANSLTDVDGLGTISYQWYANGTAISGATGSTYTLTQAEVGKTITVTASYTDGQGTAEAVTSNPTTAVANVNDAPAGTVTITGTPSQNQTLTAANSLTDVDGLGTISYQWYANGTAISGATGSTYTLTQAEVGKTITVTASYTDGQGTAEAVTSNPTTAVANVNDAPAGTVTITGTPSQNQTLTAANSLTDVDGLGTISYQWYANGTAISGATGSTYTLTQAEVGKTITVTASYTDGQGTAEAVTSNPTTAVANVNDAPTAANTSISATEDTLFSGNLPAASDIEGDSISYSLNTQANHGTAMINADGSFTYTPSANYNGADSFTYTIDDGNGGSNTYTVTVSVAAVNDAPKITSGSTASKINENSGAGQVVYTATSLDNDDITNSISYSLGGTDAALFSINASTGVVTLLDDPNYEAKSSYSFTVTATDSNNLSSEAKTVLFSIKNVDEPSTGDVSIIGILLPGHTLSVNDTLEDPDGISIVNYIWKADNVIIGFGKNYTLTANDAGKEITVVASYIDGYGTSENRTNSVVTDIPFIPNNGTHKPTQTDKDNKSTITHPLPDITNVTIFKDPENNLTNEKHLKQKQSVAVTDLASHVEKLLLNSTNNKGHLDDLNFDSDAILTSKKRIYSSQVFQTARNQHEYTAQNDTLSETEFLENLDKIRLQFQQDGLTDKPEHVEVEIMLGTTIAFTAGFVSWILRGGALLSSFMSTVPLLNRFDPIPILNASKKKDINVAERESGDDDDLIKEELDKVVEETNS